MYFTTCLQHCVNCVRIRSYSGPHFPAFGLNTERFCPYSVRMQESTHQNNSEYRQILRSAIFYNILLILQYLRILQYELYSPFPSNKTAERNSQQCTKAPQRSVEGSVRLIFLCVFDFVKGAKNKVYILNLVFKLLLQRFH